MFDATDSALRIRLSSARAMITPRTVWPGSASSSCQALCWLRLRPGLGRRVVMGRGPHLRVVGRVRGIQVSTLDIAVAYGLVDGLCLDSLAACDERDVQWAAETKQAHANLVGATKI